MKTLDQFGIIPDLNTSPARSPLWSKLDHSTHSEQALNMLSEIARVLQPTVATQLATYGGRWHPAGFMIFGLGRHPELGFLRLHVWPDIPRDAAPKGETIHDHSWSIASLALAGTYRDSIYAVEEQGSVDTTEPLPTGVLRVFTAPYRSDGSQTIHTDGSCVTADAVLERSVPASQPHTIEPGVFHRPTIPCEDFAATLVFSGYRALPTGAYFLAESLSGTSHERRPVTTPAQLDSISVSLLDRLVIS